MMVIRVMVQRGSDSGAPRFWVTCYTDASFIPGRAGWSVWLRSVEGRVVRSGACPPYVKSSLEAEVAAIFAGIFLSCRTWGDAVRGVVVRTDCQQAIDHLSAESLRPSLQRRQPGLVRLREKIRALIEQHRIELDLRWVKGHQETNTAQAFLNRACDRLAAKARSAALPPPPKKKKKRRKRRRRRRGGAASPRRGGSASDDGPARAERGLTAARRLRFLFPTLIPEVAASFLAARGALARRTLPLLALVALAACNPTLPAAPPHVNVAPAPRPPPLDVCWVEYATDTMPASYGLAGSSDEYRWEITFSGLLVRHPQGDLLIDVGNSSHFSEETGTSGLIPGLLQKLFQGGATVVATAPDALRRVGEDPSRLRAIVLSHVHADHAGGIMDLLKTPVVLSSEEAAFIENEEDQGGFDVVKAHALAIAGRAKPIQFTSTPYENFDQSADYYGDGSVVFVPLFGHTPGSIGTFVNRSATERFFHVGDAANTLEAVEKRRGKSILLEITDHDGTQADAIAAKISQLHAQDPIVKIIPAHDRKAWQKAFGAPGTCLAGSRR